jgi:hypothetical protein
MRKALADARREARGRAAASLGPSNDDSPAVQVEMRAAELHQSWTRDTDTITDEEYTGWLARHDGNIPLDNPGRLAGWLSREIRYAGTEREIGSWAWDISRPIADQLAETAADDAAADALVEEYRALAWPTASVSRDPDPGNAASDGTACTCGHAVEEHGNDPEFPGSTACDECPEGECIAYESDGAR